jgi:hypothetical protein
MYFYQIKCCFYTQNGCMNKKILQRLIPSQTPHSNKVMEYQDVKQHIVTKSWNIGMQNITEYQSQETSANKKTPCTLKPGNIQL